MAVTRTIVKKVLKLYRLKTQCEILARHGVDPKFAAYYEKVIQYDDKIKKLLYGTDDLVRLGIKWKMLSKRKVK